jgi:hypothetical protein
MPEISTIKNTRVLIISNIFTAGGINEEPLPKLFLKPELVY